MRVVNGPGSLLLEPLLDPFHEAAAVAVAVTGFGLFGFRAWGLGG